MKKVFNSYYGGLALSNREGSTGEYSVGNLVDPYRILGYVQPAQSPTSVSVASNLGSALKDIVRYDTNNAYAIDNLKLHKLAEVTGSTTLVGTGVWPHVLNTTDNGTGLGICLYTHKKGGVLTDGIFYFGTKLKAGWTDGSTFDDDYLSAVPAGAGAFNAIQTERPYKVWQNMLHIGDGRYVSQYDGFTGNDGTMVLQKFDVGFQWVVKSFFTTSTYFGIVSRGYYRDDISEIVLWDGYSSTQAVKRFTVPYKVTVASELGDNIIFLCEGVDGGTSLRTLGNNGLELLLPLEIENTSTVGTVDSFTAPTRYSQIINFKDSLLFVATGGTTSSVFGYGRKSGKYPYALRKLLTPADANVITCVKEIANGKICVSYYTGTTYRIAIYNTGYGAGTFKPLFEELGQKARINYVKFYFKPLVTSDAMTVTLDTDYGTSYALGTITYTTDGAVTSKRFDVKLFCHAFRPTVAWTAGGTAISKIEIDYDYVDDL